MRRHLQVVNKFLVYKLRCFRNAVDIECKRSQKERETLRTMRSAHIGNDVVYCGSVITEFFYKISCVLLFLCRFVRMWE